MVEPLSRKWHPFTEHSLNERSVRLSCVFVWESHDIAANRAAIRKRQERRFRAWVKSIFYYKARLVIIAMNIPQDPSPGPSNT